MFTSGSFRAEPPRRFFGNHRIDGETRPHLEPRLAAQARHYLQVPMKIHRGGVCQIIQSFVTEHLTDGRLQGSAVDDQIQGRIAVDGGQTAQGEGKHLGQGGQIVIVRLGQVRPVPGGHQKHFPGKTAGPRRQGRPAVVAVNHSLGGLHFGGHQIAQETSAGPGPVAREPDRLVDNEGRQFRSADDLHVGMSQGRARLRTVVAERRNVFVSGPPGENLRAAAQDLQQFEQFGFAQ